MASLPILRRRFSYDFRSAQSSRQRGEFLAFIQSPKRLKKKGANRFDFVRVVVTRLRNREAFCSLKIGAFGLGKRILVLHEVREIAAREDESRDRGARIQARRRDRLSGYDQGRRDVVRERRLRRQLTQRGYIPVYDTRSCYNVHFFRHAVHRLPARRSDRHPSYLRLHVPLLRLEIGGDQPGDCQRSKDLHGERVLAFLGRRSFRAVHDDEKSEGGTLRGDDGASIPGVERGRLVAVEEDRRVGRAHQEPQARQGRLDQEVMRPRELQEKGSRLVSHQRRRSVRHRRGLQLR